MTARSTASTGRRPTLRSATSSRRRASRPSTEPNEALLRAITRSTDQVRQSAVRLAAGSRTSRCALEPSADGRRVEARARPCSGRLPNIGYGQIKPTGIIDAETQAAIEKFERERRLPVTGQVSDRVTRELAAMTGRPLE